MPQSTHADGVSSSSSPNEIMMMFTGGTDTTLAAARILDEGEVDKLHLVTFCNGICIKVENSAKHAEELKTMYGAEKIHHEIIYVTELFERLRSPLWTIVKESGSTLSFDLCCRLSMETAAIIYALDHGIDRVCDGTNIDQGRLFLERPEYLQVAKDYFASFGIEYFSPVYGPLGGRLGRRAELVERGFSVGPEFLEKVNITTCIGHQPFCMAAFHTFMFTSFVRDLPIVGNIVERFGLPLDRAIKLRLDRERIGREIVEEHLAFNASNENGIRIQEHFCTTRLCGKNAVEIMFPRGSRIDLEGLAKAWLMEDRSSERDGELLLTSEGDLQLQVHPTGKVIFVGTKDRKRAEELLQRLLIPHDVIDA